MTKRKSVCFVSMPEAFENYPSPSVALLHAIASAAGMETAVLDLSLCREKESAKRRLLEASGDTLIFCSLTSALLPMAHEMLGWLSGHRQVNTLASGPAFSFMTEHELSRQPFSTVFVGCAELEFREWCMAQHIPPNSQGDNSCRIVNASGNGFLDVIPNYSWVDKPYPYTIFGVNKAVGVEYSRGCSNGCHFCTVRQLYKRRVIKPIEQLRAEIKYYEKTFGHLTYLDSMVNHSAGDIENLIRAMNTTGMTWAANFHVAEFDEALINRLVSSGLTDICVGVESFSARMLEQIGKPRHPNIDAKGMIKKFGDAGVNVIINMITGSDPYQNQADFDVDMEALEELDPYIWDVCINTLGLPDGTHIAKDCTSKGVIRHDAENWRTASEPNKSAQRARIMERHLQQWRIGKYTREYGPTSL